MQEIFEAVDAGHRKILIRSCNGAGKTTAIASSASERRRLSCGSNTQPDQPSSYPFNAGMKHSIHEPPQPLSLHMAEKIDIPESRTARWLLFGMAFAFVIAAVWIYLSGVERVVTLGAAIVFAAVAIKLFSWAMSPGARVSITDLGIEDSNNGFGLIEWRDITGVRSAFVEQTEFISITVRNEAEYLARLSPMKRRMTGLGVRMGYSPITIGMFNLKITSQELVEMIEQRLKL
jgi:hypothetical protein